MDKTIFLALAITMTAGAWGQSADTVVVSLGKASQVVLTVGDKSDIETLRYYDFQGLFRDILNRIERGDTALASSPVESDTNYESEQDNEHWEGEDDDERDEHERWTHHRSVGNTWHTANFDLGINNYLTGEDQFPDRDVNHSVRPWGSWYVGINSLQRTRAARNFFIEWGLGISWYNFKFANDRTLLSTSPETVIFTEDDVNTDYDYLRSKLRVTYLNFSLVPILDFGDHGRRPRIWDSYGSKFRIGVGPYVGYRIGSKSKISYIDEEGERRREKTRDSFYLNDLRYGARLQLGFRATDFFVNYDMNELFKAGRGPQLNAVSFGIIF